MILTYIISWCFGVGKRVDNVYLKQKKSCRFFDWPSEWIRVDILKIEPHFFELLGVQLALRGREDPVSPLGLPFLPCLPVGEQVKQDSILGQSVC